MKFRALIKRVQRMRFSVILEPRLFMETVVLYHYTTTGGLHGIQHSGYIRQTMAHPTAGLRNMTGVYLTKLDPWNYTKDQPAFPDLLSSQG